MNKTERFIVIFIGLVVLSAGLSIASFSYRNNNIATQYSAGESIAGTINISFTNEPADSLFTSNFNGSITLIKLLEANNLAEGINYNCTYTGCGSVYKDSGTPSGDISLTESEPIIFGFKIEGNDVNVNFVNFSITGDAQPDCEIPLLIDVLNNNLSFIQSSKYSLSEGLCDSETSTCSFNSNAPTQLVEISSSPLCEKITLMPAPAYEVSANIQSRVGSKTIKMYLQGLEGQSLQGAWCNLTMENNCVINQTILVQKDYLVCIYSDEISGYIKSENSGLNCGTLNEGSSYDIDFDIFAQPLKFDTPGEVRVNEDSFSSMNPENYLGLIEEINNYLYQTYQGNCSKGCFIPFKIKGVSQNVGFGDAKVTYTRGSSGASFLANGPYLLEEEKSTIKTPTNKPINLEIIHAEFAIPVGSSAKQFYLYYNGDEILRKTISITPSFSFDISPKSISFGALTTFQAITSANITSSIWNFGDGTTGTSSGKTISHRYTTYDPDGYTVGVNLTRKDGIKAPASFSVSVGSLSESATSLLNEYTIRVANLSSEITSFSPFISGNLRNRFNITNMQNSLNASRRMINNASYLEAINSALAINPPASLESSEKGVNIPLEFGFGNMNVGYIKDLSPASGSSDEDLKKAISSWFGKNYDVKINYEIISRTDDNNIETPVLTDFRLSINKKTGADASANDAHLIIGYPKASIIFADAGNYSATPVGSGVDIPITGSTNIEFLIYGDKAIEISALGMYISPEIDQLGSYGAVEIIAKVGFNWGKFILWFGVLLVFALAIYALLQQWYKKRYEGYLFKNPADLYNLITFIYNSRKAGLVDGEIGRKLRKANWKGEQIAYAFRKINGERTGLPALPFFGSFEKKKIIEEIEKRKQPAQPEPSQIKQNLY